MDDVRDFMGEDTGWLGGQADAGEGLDDAEEDPEDADLRDGDSWTTAQLAALTRYVCVQ